MTVEGMLLTIGLGAWLLLRRAKEDTARQDLLDPLLGIRGGY